MESQENPKLQEIFDILLLAGYFRVRIPSISVFDKILGGMTWCISCSNIDIDINYNDDMSMGQKITLCEKVVECLIKMQTPYDLFPHQIRGLDYEKLFPVFQWLIKFVIETREYRQDFNKNMSGFLGSKFLNNSQIQEEKLFIRENIENCYVKDRRLTKNSKIIGFARRDPLRVYSSLIEFDDKTAYNTYNKLCALISNKGLQNKNLTTTKEGSGPSNQANPLMKKQSISANKGHLQEQDNKITGFVSMPQSSTVGNIAMGKGVALISGGNTSSTGGTHKMSLEGGKQGNLADIGQNFGVMGGNTNMGQFGRQSSGGQQSLDFYIFGEEGLYNQQGGLGPINEALDEKESLNFHKLERRQSKIGENLFKLVSENKEKIAESVKAAYEENLAQDDEMEFATLIRNEKERHVQEVSRINKKFEQNETEIENLKEFVISQDDMHEELQQQLAEHKKNQEELEDTIAVIQSKIDDYKQKVSSNQMNKIQGLIDKKNELKEKKITIKKTIKTEMQDYEREKKELEQNAPQYSQELLENMASELARKKEKYDKKYKDYATLNQQVAVLQRKIESCPSASEIAQYHQRIFELFDKITVEMEKYRMSYILQNNYHDVKNVLLQNVDVMRIFKENYSVTAKSKTKKEEFLKNLQVTLTQLNENLKKSVEILDKSKQLRDKNHEDYTFLLHLEREYYKILKELQMEYEKNEYFLEKMEELEAA